ncbi:MAG TPA: VOC family protein [Alphaproteobacteria bacterium]|nr:VOC family protein [Alphaproteobacteria bacterium]
MADHFGFTKLVVGDLEKSAAFYKSVCGLVERTRVESEINGRTIREILFNATAPNAGTFVLLSFTDSPKPAAGETILGFMTPDLSGFVDRARAAGGSVAQDIKTAPEHGVKVAFVRDVEGHLIEVVELLR